jgi:Arc/MetJ-type ribon-helix-helix transcriptional regulator
MRFALQALRRRFDEAADRHGYCPVRWRRKGELLILDPIQASEAALTELDTLIEVAARLGEGIPRYPSRSEWVRWLLEFVQPRMDENAEGEALPDNIFRLSALALDLHLAQFLEAAQHAARPAAPDFAKVLEM